MTVIVIHVLKRGARANEILAYVAQRVTGSEGLEPSTTEGSGPVRLMVEMPAEAARAETRRLLDEAGDDWQMHLHFDG